MLASVIGNSNGLSQTTISETLQTCRPRSKSARKKQKLSMPTRSSIECSQERPPRRTCCNFFVPAYGQHENGGYQDQKHFGLIEGMGGGEEEIERGSTNPHRGRLLELPGSVMPGMWEANIQHNADVETNEDAEIHQEELQALSLSLRHVSASSTPLERYFNGVEPTPHGLVVSKIDPSIHRISSFIKQGVFTNEEVDFCIEGEEKMLNNSYLSCLLFVTFDGFTSSSDSTNDAENYSEAMLAKCVWPFDGGCNVDYGRRHELHMFGGVNEREATGVLFPCELDFDCQYYILVSHDVKFRISAIDVIFRKPESPQLLLAPHVHLTESILSEHRLNAGSGVGEIMERFVAQQSLKTESEWPDSLEELATVDVDNFHPVLDADVKSEMLEASTIHYLEEPSNSANSNDNLQSSHPNKRECADEGEVDEAKSAIVSNCEAVGGINPSTDEHDDGDKNFVFDDPMNEDPDEECNIKDHPTNKDQEREHMVENEAIATFNAACKDVQTINQSPKIAEGGVEKPNPEVSALDDKTSLYSRLSNICRNSTVQSRRKSGTLMRKRSLPYNTNMVNTQKRLRRASDTSVHATSTQQKTTSRKAKDSTCRATFPSTSRAAVKSSDLKSAAKKTRSVAVVDLFGEETFPSPSKAAINAANYLKSAAKKTRAVAVVDLFGETESLFGCNVISHAYVDQGRKITANVRYSSKKERDRMLKQDEVQSSLAFVSSDDNHERISGANSAPIFDDADDASKVSSESGEVTVPHRSTADDTTDNLGGTKLFGGEYKRADAHADEFSKESSESSNEIETHRSTADYTNDHLNNTEFVSEEDNPADAFEDARSINSICGASFSLGNNNDNLVEVGATSAKSALIAQPFFDIYFGREDLQSTLIPMPSTVVSFVVKSQPFYDQYYGQESDIRTVEEEVSTFQPPHSIYFGLCDDSDSSIHSNLELGSSLNPSICTESQPFHDQYYGQETIIGLEDKYEYSCRSLHGTCFGLYDDSVSSVQSQLEFISLINPTRNIPHYDYYFGQEAYLSECSDNDANTETEKRVGRVPICGVQSQPLLVLVLLAGMLTSAIAL